MRTPSIVRFAQLCVIVALTGSASACSGGAGTVLEQVLEARRLTADMMVQFTKAADVGNLAVMADTEEAAGALVRESAAATQAVRTDADALAKTLDGLGYANENRLLGEFNTAFAKYVELDAAILGLAGQNTNLKAQRLSFGAGQQAADAFSSALGAVTPSTPADRWRVDALVATALERVRAIQVLQAPHIAEASDATMTSIEERMAASETAARTALRTLRTLVPSGSQGLVDAAGTTLDRFMSVNAEIVALSRRNSNVRSLALSLGQKRALTATCEEALRSLRTVLANRQLGGTR